MITDGGFTQLVWSYLGCLPEDPDNTTGWCRRSLLTATGSGRG